MRRPEDVHHDRVDERSYEVVSLVIPLLEERGFDYVLAGGWAAFAYGTRVASADTDVFLPARHAEEVSRLVEKELGVTTGPGGRFEPLALERFNRILGPDAELGERERGYVPADLLKGRVRRMPLVLPRTSFEANVPEPREFAFTKLKAFHDRELAYRALRDPAVMARLPPSDRGEVREKVESYYAAKAGKDLFDVAHTLAHHADLNDVLDLARRHDLLEDLEPPLRAPARHVRRVALGLARDERTRAWIERNVR